MTDYSKIAFDLAEFCRASNYYMTRQERADGIEQMLHDLELLATRDGCIAAAWALEFLTTESKLDHEDCQALDGKAG